MEFLQALPPVLGFAGFVIYQLLRPRSSSHQIISKVLDKVRAEPGVIENPHYKGLAKKDLLAALQSDQKLRTVVGREDSAILMKAMERQFQTDMVVHLSLVVFAVAGLLVFSLLGPKAPPPDRGDSEPQKTATTEEKDPRMKTDDFEKGIGDHYQEHHGKIARDYMGQPENVNRLLGAFLMSADKKLLGLCEDVTDELITGFCPAHLTATIEGFDAYPSPEKKTDLNSWVKRIEDMPVRVRVVLDGETLELTRSVEWWVLYCGTLEYLRTDATETLEDARKLGEKARRFIRNTLRGLPRLSISELVATVQGLGFEAEVVDRLGRMINDLPADLNRIHTRFACKYCDFLRMNYSGWHNENSPPLAHHEALHLKIKEFLIDLLQQSKIQVKQLEVVD